MVRLRADAAAPANGRYVYRGKQVVNVSLVRSGDVRAAAGRLALAAQLTAAQSAAQQAGRGLWQECAAPPAPAPAPAPAPPTGDAAIQRARADLSGRALIHLTATTFSSSQST